MIEINKIYNEDCFDTMKKIPDNFIDLIVTSPPYNCGIKYDNYDDNKDWKEYLEWCKLWLIEIKRILKEDGRICLNILLDMNDLNKNRISPFVEFYNIFKEINLNIHGTPLWIDSHRVKYTAWGSWLSASSPYIYCPYEVIIIGYKNIWKKINNGKTNITKKEFIMGCSGIWKLKTETNQLTKANFHEDLSNLCIKLLSYENNLVYDPFIGSGTTAISAIKNNRNFLGSEISKNYYSIANQRILDVQTKKNFPF